MTTTSSTPSPSTTMKMNEHTKKNQPTQNRSMLTEWKIHWFRFQSSCWICKSVPQMNGILIVCVCATNKNKSHKTKWLQKYFLRFCFWLFATKWYLLWTFTVSLSCVLVLSFSRLRTHTHTKKKQQKNLYKLPKTINNITELYHTRTPTHTHKQNHILTTVCSQICSLMPILMLRIALALNGKQTNLIYILFLSFCYCLFSLGLFYLYSISVTNMYSIFPYYINVYQISKSNNYNKQQLPENHIFLNNEMILWAVWTRHTHTHKKSTSHFETSHVKFIFNFILYVIKHL